jgi:hypothetical protein
MRAGSPRSARTMSGTLPPSGAPGRPRAAPAVLIRAVPYALTAAVVIAPATSLGPPSATGSTPPCLSTLKRLLETDYQQETVTGDHVLYRRRGG